MKEPYEKPKMVTETIDIGMLVAGSALPIPQLEALLASCAPCGTVAW